jgi:hypothetical protein
MKSFCVAVFLVILMRADVRGQEAGDISTITLTRQTRAYFEEVVISRDSVHSVTENHRLPEQSKRYAAAIEPAEWTELITSIGNVSLEDIDGLQSPTMNRARDAAVHSTIDIGFKGGESVSHSFDDENPHPDLKPLLDAIDKFRLPDAR